MRMILLHKTTSEESSRLFFQDVYHMLVKILMNPFYVQGSKINDPKFEKAVRELARHRLLPVHSYPY